MKSIKNLGIKTKEGFEVKNLKRFPSMEWGENGGLEAEVYLDGKLAGTIFDAGDGGEPNFTYANSALTRQAIAARGLAFLKRTDPDYGGHSKYSHLFTGKTVENFDNSDYQAIVNVIEERHEIVKQAKKSFKNGYKAVAALKSTWEIRYLQYRVEDITPDEVKQWLKDSGNDKKYPEFEILTCSMDLSVL